jgi:hypothetical protein
MRVRRRSSSPALTDELVAIVEGRVVEYLVNRRMVVPAWAWLNLLAHGLEVDLIETAGNPRRRHQRSSWAAARRFLAAEVLDAAACEGSLLELQRRVLVPLELELMERTRRVTSPIALVRLVVERLDSSPSDRTIPGWTP